MEIVNENEEAQPKSALDEERSRMMSNVQSVAQKVQRNDGPSMPSRKPVARTSSMRSGRGTMRTSSMQRGVRPVAPTKSTDCMSSMRGSSLQRANSSRLAPLRNPSRGALIRASSSRAPPSRRALPDRTSSVDSTASLRAYQRDQLANGLIEGGRDKMRGPGATLERNTSDMSGITAGDLSCFTMDSVNLRKTQMVADPIEDGTYNEVDSCADHESISRMSQFSEYKTPAGMPPPPRMGVSRTPSRMGAIRLDKMSISNKPDHDDSDSDEDSFGTMTSGLTTDFTEHDELLDSDNDDDDEDHLED